MTACLGGLHSFHGHLRGSDLWVSYILRGRWTHIHMETSWEYWLTVGPQTNSLAAAIIYIIFPCNAEPAFSCS